MADITMPQLGETVTEGTIIRWLKQVGDQVAHDEPLFEVSTEKVDSEVPSSAEGYLNEILVDEGATVDVGTRLAVIGEAASAAEPAAAPVDEAASAAEPVAGPGEETADAAEPVAAPGQETADASEPVAGPGEETADAAEPVAAPGEETADAADAPAAAPAAADTGTPAADLEEPASPGDESTSGVGADGAGGTPRATAAPPSSAPPASSEDGATGAGTGAPLSPVVRKLINEHGLDQSAIHGTGQGGRITRGDVLSYIDDQAAVEDGRSAPAAATTASAPPSAAPKAAPSAAPASSAAATAPSSAPPTAPSSAPADLHAFPPATAGERDEIVPFSNIRRLTAEHMVRSKATSAHTLVAIEADYEGVERVRRRQKERFREEEGISLSYLPFVARAVVDVLRDYPNLNASVGDNVLLVHRDVHLGVAVDLDRQGLIVPVVRQADGQSLRGLARAIAHLAERARSRRLSADDVVGGTFTITNPGPFGTFLTAPIISQPQVAILSTDGVKRRPVVVTAADGTEAIAIHSVGMLALSFDHRAVDGAYASAFLHDLAREIETRDWSTEL